MTTHWLHVALSWGLTLGVFAALAVAATLRYRQARQALDRLEAEGRAR
jgi:heme exporter protein CcmD